MQHYKNPYLVHFGTFAPSGPGMRLRSPQDFTPVGPLHENEIVILQGNELKKRRQQFESKMHSLELDYAYLHNSKLRASRPHHTEDDVRIYNNSKQMMARKIKELQDAMEEFTNLASLGNDYQEVPAMNEEKQTEWTETLKEYKI